jgi:hypothetical protein
MLLLDWFVTRLSETGVMEKILAHRAAKAAEPETSRRSACRALARQGLFD